VRPTQTVQVNGAVQVASASAEPVETPVRAATPVTKSVVSSASAPPVPSRKPEPAPFTSGVIQTQPIAAIPGSSEPMKPVRVKTVQVKSGQFKLASASPDQPPTTVTNTVQPRNDAPSRNDAENSSSLYQRAEMPRQPANHGTGQGLLGVLPAAGNQAMAYAEPSPRAPPQPQAVQQGGAIKPVASHTGWIIQVGALDSESEARLRLDAAREQARGLLGKADPFTEPVVGKGEKKLFRARFAGLDRDQAEAVCKTLKRSEISCITIKN
jgi:D-alanyl-D-alanine carboxypeptidase